ncbi:conjugal transfer protein TraD [Sphingomonas populi]|uniref:Conjugal transfer protein TraD n=1 Tax=Sphingomonas populi TaxID=2484750 RepID=A0A4Q6Y4Q9_9SPHN|nr:conjugal transfer protein TraD [Sphingomonas populi]RZF64844.1 conjugal transfer protein TraD [Sphingomonas populi]
MRYHLIASRARHDTRDWQVKRRERTRQLIELDGLVAKSGLIDLTDDDRAVIFGILVEAAARLRGEDKDQSIMVWRRRGKRAFEDDSINDHLR